jgi:hypothetical protein
MPPRSIFAPSDDFLLPLVNLAFKGNLLVVIYIGFIMLPSGKLLIDFGQLNCPKKRGWKIHH